MKSTKVTTLLLSLFLVLGLISAGFAENFPTRPIRVVNPYAPGGATDILARAFQRPFEAALGVKVIIDNKPGGSTKIGVMEAMNAKSNGYTILLTSDVSWVSFYYSQIFDLKLWEVLTPIGNLTTEPWNLVEVRKESPFKTWADLVKAAKENPGKLTCGGSAAGGMPLFFTNQIGKGAGIQIKHVPFSGAGPAQIALLGGHIDFRTCTAPEAMPMIRSGKTRALAVTYDKRIKALLPGVPTFDELGMKLPAVVTRAIWGPPKLPQNITDIIAKAIEKGTQDPEFIKLVEESLFFTVEFRPGQRMREAIMNFDKDWGPSFIETFK